MNIAYCFAPWRLWYIECYFWLKVGNVSSNDAIQQRADLISLSDPRYCCWHCGYSWWWNWACFGTLLQMQFHYEYHHSLPKTLSGEVEENIHWLWVSVWRVWGLEHLYKKFFFVLLSCILIGFLANWIYYFRSEEQIKQQYWWELHWLK